MNDSTGSRIVIEVSGIRDSALFSWGMVMIVSVTQSAKQYLTSGLCFSVRVLKDSAQAQRIVFDAQRVRLMSIIASFSD